MLWFLGAASAACPASPLPVAMGCLAAQDAEIGRCGRPAARVRVSWEVVDRRARALSVLDDGGDPEQAACVAARLLTWTFPVGLDGPVEWGFQLYDPTTTTVLRAPPADPTAPDPALPRLEVQSPVPLRIIDSRGVAIDPANPLPGAYRVLAVFDDGSVTDVGRLELEPGDVWHLQCSAEGRYCKLNEKTPRHR
ncbi:MAG: hypothetical protein KC656_21665 [Myxococcales bacterium]|nr:hypothetical protein [Myxococcales bacterium]